MDRDLECDLLCAENRHLFFSVLISDWHSCLCSLNAKDGHIPALLVCFGAYKENKSVLLEGCRTSKSSGRITCRRRSVYLTLLIETVFSPRATSGVRLRLAPLVRQQISAPAEELDVSATRKHWRAGQEAAQVQI